MLYDDLYLYTLIKQLKDKLLDSIDSSYFVDFKERHFELLSKEIKRKTGWKLSESTLKRIIRYGLSYTGNNDKRRLRSLDILSVFLNYEGWQDFIRRNGFEIKIMPVDRYIALRGVQKNLIKRNLLALNDIEFRSLKKLPVINTKSISRFYVRQDIELLNFISLLHFKKSQNIALIPNNRACKYEISIDEINFLNDKVALVTVSYTRALYWCHINTLLNIEYFTAEGGKNYLMRKVGKGWVIDSSLFDNLKALGDEDEDNRFWIEVQKK